MVSRCILQPHKRGVAGGGLGGDWGGAGGGGLDGGGNGGRYLDNKITCSTVE
jgi:hypothetical protein